MEGNLLINRPAGLLDIYGLDDRWLQRLLRGAQEESTIGYLGMGHFEKESMDGFPMKRMG